MSKTIRISDNAFLGLQAKQKPRESYSETIDRLLQLVSKIESAELEYREKTVSRPPGG